MLHNESQCNEPVALAHSAHILLACWRVVGGGAHLARGLVSRISFVNNRPYKSHLNWTFTGITILLIGFAVSNDYSMIQLESISKSFRGTEVLKEISLEFRNGECVAFWAPMERVKPPFSR